MADKSISELDSTNKIYSTDKLILEQNGTAKSIKGSDFVNQMLAALDGHGGISSIDQTTTSTANGGTNVVTITMVDGTTASFNVQNGTKGSKGDTGTSPIITTSKSGSVTTITIVDAEGTKTASISDGGLIIDTALSTESENPLANKTVTGSLFRPNLLDNWYFANPVNQRGVTSWSDGYGFDRWYAAQSTCVAGSGYLEMTTTDCVFQRVEASTASALAGQTLTASMLYADGTLETGSAVFAQNTVAVQYGTTNMSYYYNNGAQLLRIGGSTTKNVVAVKVEIGETQTLAHLDANGAWVLNEIPNYAEQLRRCQRYYFPNAGRFASGWIVSDGSGTTTSTAHITLHTPVEMRTVPTIVIPDSTALDNLVTGDNDVIPLATVTAQTVSGCDVFIAATVNTAVANFTTCCTVTPLFHLSADL